MGRRQEDKTGHPAPARRRLTTRGDRREVRGRGRRDKSQEPQGHGSAVCTGLLDPQGRGRDGVLSRCRRAAVTSRPGCPRRA